MIITKDELSQIQYLLPVQSDIETLVIVEGIFVKINKLIEKNQNDETYDISFSEKEIIVFKESIMVLDSQKRISLSCLSLVKKFLNFKGE